METFFAVIKAALFGIIEGITEWLPISSTGHMILFDEFVKLGMGDDFWDMFIVVIQLGAILAVVVMFWKRLWPFSLTGDRQLNISKPTIVMWLKIAVACVPAAVVGLLFDDKLDELFRNYQTVSISLIIFGILFILIENRNRGKTPRINSIAQIDYKTAAIIGVFQLIAAVFPGTSRSGATILGAILLGISRTAAAEFTFFLAVPVMVGASFVKLVKFGFAFSGAQVLVLLTGMIVAFAVSVVAIKFLMDYVKKHDFKPFGIYRIVLGLIVLVYFLTVGKGSTV